ncbi:MAG: GTPase HflX, partial [Planctomycetota bacterium]
MRGPKSTVYRERALLVAMVDEGRDGPPRPRAHRDHLQPLDELASLTETAGADVVERVIQRRQKPNPRTFLGSGKVAEIGARAKELKADVVVFDHELSPGQVRNLERALDVKVLDRTELILDIFATHARTHLAKLQVELAQLEYNLPRLKRMWTHLEKQVGGTVGGVGGIGMRGPGEKQIEVDRRLAHKRIRDLKREMRSAEKRKQRQVTSRALQNYTVSLVGYTNAGKSTLMNRLTKAGVLVDNRLFSTLDTRTRVWQLRTGLKLFLSDTVGFIRSLPHDLVASFHATLEEVTQADLLLHVVDASHPEAEDQIRAVSEVLREIKCDEKETLLVLNKVDRFRDKVELEVLRNRRPEAALASARTGHGMKELAERVERVVSERLEEMEVLVPASEGRLLAEVGASCVVLKRSFDNNHVRMRLRVPRRHSWKLAR